MLRSYRSLGFWLVIALSLLGIRTVPVSGESRSHAGGMLRDDTFGAGWTGDSLSNVEIGRFMGRTVSYRFRANHTGTFSAVELYLIFRTICDGCYANGDGGIIQVQIQTDDGTANHLPAGILLGTAIISNPMLQWNRVVTFDQSVAVQENTLYHMVFTNLSSDPVHNYVSINNLYNVAGGSDSQPSANTVDLAALIKPDSNHPMQVNTHLVPIFSLLFDDSYRQGQIYMDVRPNSLLGASSTQIAEEFLVNDANHTVSSLSVRLSPLVTQGDIRVTVLDSSNQMLASGVIDLTHVLSNGYNWYTVSFPSISLVKGAGYSVVMTAENGAQYYIAPMQQGMTYNFQWERRYAGECEVLSAGQWKGCLGRTDLDIPFYFR